jgi:hypothetical protein
MKVPTDIWNPYPAISAIVDPSAVRPQFIIENIERNATIISVIIIIITVVIVIIILVVISVIVVFLGI